MNKKKYDIALINRSFWPDFPVLGEGLLRFAERLSEKYRVVVISQGQKEIKPLTNDAGRARNVDFNTFLNPPNSSYSLIRRIFEATAFTFWVFFRLAKNRPKLVYVATDPPVLVPFFVFLYCKLYKAKYIYHIQDIHPEITSIYLGKKGAVLKPLKLLDNITILNASHIITLSEEMKKTLMKRTKLRGPITLLDNPAMRAEGNTYERRPDEIVYCGNAGRLQLIPLLIKSIDEYYNTGGLLKFNFIGGGVYSKALEMLSQKHSNFHYHGFLPPEKASKYIQRATWALLPIEDEVTKFAFPSKSSSYAVNDITIIGVCGRETSVSSWIIDNDLGLVLEPSFESLFNFFRSIEHNTIEMSYERDASRDLIEKLSSENFSLKLSKIVSQISF